MRWPPGPPGPSIDEPLCALLAEPTEKAADAGEGAPAVPAHIMPHKHTCAHKCTNGRHSKSRAQAIDPQTAVACQRLGRQTLCSSVLPGLMGAGAGGTGPPTDSVSVTESRPARSVLARDGGAAGCPTSPIWRL